MSRIRSIHPGIWTDEEFMGLSAFARLLLIGLWTEAWDDGVFEWKPLTLKARIFPVDPVDVVALLSELQDAGVIARMDANQKRPGVIKNFQKYQRPKKPNSSGLMQDEWLEYVGAKATPDPSDDDISEPVPNQFPTGGEKPSQMEDGGWKREDEDAPPIAPQGGGAGDLFEDLLGIYPVSPNAKRDRAFKAFSRRPTSEQHDIIAAARKYRAWFDADCIRRGRSPEEAAGFVPPLDGWIINGTWKSVSGLSEAPKVEPMVKLNRVSDEALWLACERVQGKKAPTSDSTWSFRQSVVDEAKASLSHDIGGERVA